MISSSFPAPKQASYWLTYLVYQLEACLFFGAKLLELMSWHWSQKKLTLIYLLIKIVRQFRFSSTYCSSYINRKPRFWVFGLSLLVYIYSTLCLCDDVKGKLHRASSSSYYTTTVLVVCKPKWKELYWHSSCFLLSKARENLRYI